MTTDSPWVYYYENGQISEEGRYLNGVKNWKWVSYWEDGTEIGPLSGDYNNGSREYRSGFRHFFDKLTKY